MQRRGRRPLPEQLGWGGGFWGRGGGLRWASRCPLCFLGAVISGLASNQGTAEQRDETAVMSRLGLTLCRRCGGLVPPGGPSPAQNECRIIFFNHFFFPQKYISRTFTMKIHLSLRDMYSYLAVFFLLALFLFFSFYYPHTLLFSFALSAPTLVIHFQTMRSQLDLSTFTRAGKSAPSTSF